MLAPPHTGINNTARVYPWLSPSTRPWSILPTRAAGAALTCDYSRPPPPCTAPVTPAALSSEHKHPYFRVGRIDNHIDGCTEGATRVDPPDTAVVTDEHKGQEAPRDPDRLVHITLRRPQSAAARTVQGSTHTVDPPLGYRRSPSTVAGDRPLTFQCGVRPHSEHQRRKRLEHTFHQTASIKRRSDQSDDHDRPGPLRTAAHPH